MILKRSLIRQGENLITALAVAIIVNSGQLRAEEWKAPAEAEAKKNPVAIDEKSLAAGKETWTNKCEMCHGTGGKGDGPIGTALAKRPGDLTTATVTSQSDGALFWKITEGKVPMPPFTSLTEEQRWQTLNYMRTLSKPAQDGATSTTK